jgi:hypothetical protein
MEIQNRDCIIRNEDTEETNSILMYREQIRQIGIKELENKNNKFKTSLNMLSNLELGDIVYLIDLHVGYKPTLHEGYVIGFETVDKKIYQPIIKSDSLGFNRAYCQVSTYEEINNIVYLVEYKNLGSYKRKAILVVTKSDADIIMDYYKDKKYK